MESYRNKNDASGFGSGRAQAANVTGRATADGSDEPTAFGESIDLDVKEVPVQKAVRGYGKCWAYSQARHACTTIQIIYQIQLFCTVPATHTTPLTRAE
jgi:hypothetical protein